MGNMQINNPDLDYIYEHISALIDQRRKAVQNVVNNAMVSMYWNVGKYLVDEVLQNQKPEYGKRIIENISNRLSENYGSGFDKSAVTRMIQFYQEFPEEQIVATLSQQLTWSHFVILLPIKDKVKRNFYATMCRNENWSVRTLRERKNSMLFERTSISQKPEDTIKNELFTSSILWSSHHQNANKTAEI